MAIKVSANLPDQAVDALKELSVQLAQRSGRPRSATEALIYAISLAKTLNDEVSQGAKILIQQKDGQVSELQVTIVAYES